MDPVKVCPLCNRVFGSGVDICEHDGQRLIAVRRNDTTGGTAVVEWDGPLAGDIVGNYRLESMVAEGGMGRIFQATHLTLGRRVAIKFLLPEHAARADLVQRFFNEARSVNAVRHPHILEIYDFVQEHSPEGATLVYMLMEYLEGEDLRVRLSREGHLPAASVVDIAIQVAEALATAHDAGILHRDLKPDNIFLCQQPLDFVKVLDFGAAKAFGDRPEANLTRPGVAIGTPEYMAPEQIRNKTLDGRVDEYALGILLYELLTGEVPFTSKNVAKVLAMHTRQAPPRMQTRHVDIPASLEAFVLRCLKKDPDERYPDLWTAADALREVLAPPARTPWPTPAPSDTPMPMPTLPTNEVGPMTGPLPSESVRLRPDPHTLPATPTENPTVEARPQTRGRAREASGMPTLDRRFGRSSISSDSSDSSNSSSPTHEPLPNDVEIPPVREAHQVEAAAPSPSAHHRHSEREHTEEVEAASWRERRSHGEGLLGLLGDPARSSEPEEDDDDDFFTELAPQRPQRRQNRHPILFAVFAILFTTAIAFAVIMFLS